MKRYAIKYTDDVDPCCPVFTQIVRALNAEHAEMKFLDAIDADGWKIISINAQAEPGTEARSKQDAAARHGGR